MLLALSRSGGSSTSRISSLSRGTSTLLPLASTCQVRISTFLSEPRLPSRLWLSTGFHLPLLPKSSLLGESALRTSPLGFGLDLKPVDPAAKVSPFFLPYQIRAGGGPRTYPGGLNKWQWKRLQEKKLREKEKSRLLREKEAFEERRRALQRVLHGPERPWEMGRGKPKHLPPAWLNPVPDGILDRFTQEKKAQDLWNEKDGPERRRLPDGTPSARFFPPGAVHSTQPYESEENRPPWLNPEADFETTLDKYFEGEPQEVAPAKRQRTNHSGGLKSTDLIQRAIKRSNLTSVNQGGGGAPFKQDSRKMSTYAGSIDPDAFSSDTIDKSTGGSGADPSFMSGVRFDSFPLSALSIRALHEDMGYEECTIVQAESLPLILSGKDVLAKAKTGTGKTIAFLLPALEKMLKAESEAGRINGRRPLGPSPIRILAICPTRELATQVAEEGKQLLKYHEGCGSQIVIGGTRMPAEVARMKTYPCQLLVGTPGRLLDHIQSTPGMRQRLQGLQVLILDECDHLLDMGFRKSLEGILQALPRERQTLLFSATMSPEVRKVSSIALKENHAFIDTVGEETTQTNIQVIQESLIMPMEKHFHAVYHVLKQHIEEEPNYKVLIFSTTARGTQLSHSLLTNLKINSLEIHSRMTQSKRTSISDAFRQSAGGIVMCTSDVSARGVDYPNVTYVIQLGVPSDRAQYIHRLGRTGRAGKPGKGLLILSEWEDWFLNKLNGIPVNKLSQPQLDPALIKKVDDAMIRVEQSIKDKAYQAWLGYYNSAKGLKFSKTQLVNKANKFASDVLLLDEPPVLPRKTVGMMGLKGVPGLRVE